MKILRLFLLSMSVLMWAGASPAQWEPNIMGLASDDPDNEWCLYGPGMEVYTVTLYLDFPENPDFGPEGLSRAVSWINGFECRVWVEGGALILGWHFPVDALNIGTDGNMAVGFAEPVLVIDGRAVLATVDIFLEYPGTQAAAKASPVACNYPTAMAHMAPMMPYPSIEGMLAYLDAEDTHDPLVGAWANSIVPDDVVMLMEATPVATEQHSWGCIKALYH